MTFVVSDNCIKCKYMDCVEVCPVDCFYEGENMLVIHPDECIDCGVCEPECPADRAAQLGDFERMGQPGAKQIPLVVQKHLGLVDQPSERGGMDDSVAIALKSIPGRRGRLRMPPAARQRWIAGIRRASHRSTRAQAALH